MATATIEMPTAAPPKTKLQESIKESTEMLIQQLQQGKSEALTAYLTTMARFHNYSFCNQMLIARQRPTATRVAGFHKWLELKRFVKKGEKGIGIFVPLITKRPAQDADPNTPAGPRLIGFKIGYVFDLEQTDGEPLPEADYYTVDGSTDKTPRLMAHIRDSGIPVDYDETIAPALGMSYGGTIKLLPGRTAAEEFTTLVHEYAHELLHKGERRQQTTKIVRETEAEAVSFIVSTALGIQYGHAAADYIQLYNGNTETLMASLKAIQETSAEILTALGEK